MKLPTIVAMTMLAVAASPLAHGENVNACTGLESSLVRPSKNLPPNVIGRIRAMARRMETLSLPTGTSCSALSKVLARLMYGSATAGFKLEDQAALDVASAQTELDQALQQSAQLKSQLESLRASVADEQDRLIYEAALLQSNDMFGARDLRLQQFIQQTKGD